MKILMALIPLGIWAASKVNDKAAAAGELIYGVKDFKLLKSKTSLWQVRFVVHVSVRNPTRESLYVDRVTMKANVNGRLVADSQTNLKQRIAPDATSILPIPATVSTAGVGLSILDVITKPDTPIDLELMIYPGAAAPGIPLVVNTTMKQLFEK